MQQFNKKSAPWADQKPLKKQRTDLKVTVGLVAQAAVKLAKNKHRTEASEQGLFMCLSDKGKGPLSPHEKSIDSSEVNEQQVQMGD
jgi:hypothetical protein